MTRYFTQWDDDTIDSTIAGWTHRTAGTAPTYVPKYGTPAVKRRYLQHKPGTTSDLRGLITWDAIDGDANRATFDALTLIKMDDWTGDYAEIWGRVAMSGTTITDGYRVRVIRAGGANNIRVDKRVASVTTTAIGTATVTMSAGKSYYVRFQANGTAIKVRVWDAALGMAGEPTTWDVSITDAGVSAAGYIGLAAVSSSTSHITPFNFFAVGTNGDSAVAPRTNAEFLAWVEKPNVRCVLAELPATGYDSGGSPYTKTVRAYVSNIGYTSAQQDSPSLQHYDAYIASIPTFSRQMGADLVGPVSVGFGDLVLRNAASGTAGRLDDWLRVSWRRDVVMRMWIGDPSWPRHDFRALMVGRLGRPTAPSMDVLKFPIADLSDSMNVPIQTRYTSGALNGQLKPAMIGDLYGGCEPPLEDAATLTYKLSDQAITSLVAPAGTDGEQSMVVYDNGVDVSTDNAFTGIRKTVTAVNAATDTLTSAGHGMLADAQVVFHSGTPPAPLTTLTSYYVISAGLTTDDFRLAVTRGGAAINITGTTTGAAYRGTNYKVDFANATLTLLATPAGRVTVYGFRDDSYAEWTIGRLYEEAVFNRGGVSLNFKDSPAFTAMHTTCSGKYYGGIWLDGNTMRTAFDVCQKISSGSLSWFGFTFDGLMQVGMISLPAASAVRSFSAADTLAGSLKMNSRIRARNYTNAIITLAPWFLKSGGIPGPNPALARGYTIGTPNAYAAAGTPLDDHPDQLDAAKTDQVDTIVATTDIIESLLKGVFKKDLGLFEFRTTLAALWHSNGPLSIGDTISLEHPRLGWKNYTGSDDPSPDNTADYDARNAVVMGIDVNLSNPVDQQVTLKVYRPIPGYYPTANLN